MTHSREAAFLRTWQSGDVDFYEPLRLRHLPYPRSARQRRTLLRIHFHTTLSQKTCHPHNTQRRTLRVCQFTDLSTLNHRPSTISNIATFQTLTNTFPPLATWQCFLGSGKAEMSLKNIAYFGSHFFACRKFLFIFAKST